MAQLKKQCEDLIQKLDGAENQMEVVLAFAKKIIKSHMKKQEKKDGKKDKDENAPQRSTNAYMIFCEDQRAGVKSKNPDAKPKDITRILSNMWKKERDGNTEIYKNFQKKLAERKTIYQAYASKHGGNAEKDDKPKRAPSAYNIFMKENQPIVKAKNPTITQKEIMVIVGKLWSNLSDADKTVYKTKAGVKDAAAPKAKKDVASPKGKKETAAPVKGKEAAKGKKEVVAPTPVKGKEAVKGKKEVAASPAPPAKKATAAKK